MNVGGATYSKIDNHPICAADGCCKKVERQGGVLTSAHCPSHTRDEEVRLMDGGLSFGQARRVIFEGRPRVRLAFVR